MTRTGEEFCPRGRGRIELGGEVRVVEGFVFRFWLYAADPKVY